LCRRDGATFRHSFTGTLLPLWSSRGVVSARSAASYAAALARHRTGARSSSVAFTTLAAAQLLHALVCRSEREPGWRGLGENRMMLAAMVDVAAVTFPRLRHVLGTAPLGGLDWATVGAGALLPVLATHCDRPCPKATPSARARRGP